MNQAFKVTYSRWLQTHSRGHEGYQERKRYNWAILSKIQFKAELLDVNQDIHTSNGVNLGRVRITKIQSQQDGSRILFEAEILEYKKNTSNVFRFIFALDGTLITVFSTDKEEQKLRSVLKGNQQNDSVTKMSAKAINDILIKIVRDLIGNDKSNKFDNFVSFDKREVSSEYLEIMKGHGLTKIKNKYVVDFSQERRIWVVVSLTARDALLKAIRFGSQCDQVISLYLVGYFNKRDQLPEGVQVRYAPVYFKEYEHTKAYCDLEKITSHLEANYHKGKLRLS
jgi:hypothetical protein